MVVPLFADESRPGRLRGRLERDARPGVGDVVSPGWKTAKLYSRISPGRAGSQQQKAESIPPPNRQQRNRRELLPGNLGSRWARDFMGTPLAFHLSRHAEQQGLDWVLANAAFRCAFFRPDHPRRPEFCGRPFGVRSARPQLWIPASQFLDLDTCLFSPA